MARGLRSDMDKAQIIKALRDTAQSASNMAANNVSGPVDMIAAGLRKAGVPIPDDAMAGSQWMEENGLTRKVDQGLPKAIGEAIGMVAPAAIAAKMPQAAVLQISNR